MSVYKVWQFLKKLNMKLPDDLEISLPGMHLKELKAKGLPWPSQGYFNAEVSKEPPDVRQA